MTAVHDGAEPRVALLAPPWIPVPPPAYGGTERVIADLAEGLHRRGVPVVVFAATGSTVAAPTVDIGPPPPPDQLDDPWLAAAAAVRTHSLLQDHGPVDVVHEHAAPVGVAVSRWAARAPVLQTLHGPWTPASRRLATAVAPPVGLIAISEAQRRGFADVPYAATIHHGINVHEFPYRDDDDGYLAFLGRASPVKGPLTAIEAARRCGLPLRLMVKAHEPDERQYLEQVLAPAARRTHAVELEVNRPGDERLGLLAGARALLSPIDWEEPFGLTTIEAMACGTPVIAPARGAVPELITPETGVVIHGDARHDPRLLAACTAEAVESLKIQRCRCRAHVARHFGVDTMVQAHLELYRRTAR